jgi:hypothetical protein
MVPTSAFDSGGNSRDIVAIADVGCASTESTDDPVKTRTPTSDPDARAAPTGTY